MFQHCNASLLNRAFPMLLYHLTFLFISYADRLRQRKQAIFITTSVWASETMCIKTPNRNKTSNLRNAKSIYF